MSMSANVVCNNVLKRAFDEGISISPMKLQKLMYFISCEYLKLTGNELLSENFGVWQYGPVLLSVYDEFKSFGGSSITKYATDANGEAYMISEVSAPNLKSAIDRIWSSLKQYDGIALSQITHLDNSGWSRAFCEGRNQISVEDMKDDCTYKQYLHS